MKTKDYIRLYQPVLYDTFRKAYQKDRLSHAYLLDGEPGTPLLKIAKYLAQSILCDEGIGVACENCRTCQRIEDDLYIDIQIVDGQKTGTIKKDEIAKILEAFSQTAMERKGIQIYIINLVEIMRSEDEAVHTLLKFLEEPHPNVYAILTTNNLERVIPTIVSRTQVIPIRLRDRESVIDEAISLGVSPNRAQLLSKLYNDPEEIQKIYTNETTSKLVKHFDEFLEQLKKGRRAAIFFNQKEIIPLLNSKESARFYLDLLSEAFREMIGIKNNLKRYLQSYDKILNALLDLFKTPEDGLYLILEARAKIEVNVTIGLILDHLIINLTKGLK